MADCQGLTHIYYGDGKGKTTAAFGLALRCAGHGKRVVIAQFLKGTPTGEVTALEALPGVTVLRGAKAVSKFTFQMNEAEKAATAQCCCDLLHQAAALAETEQARLLILDEVIDACSGFIPLQELCFFLDRKPSGLEVVLTGHSLPPELAQRADYISHIVKEKHPYDAGISARKDIEF